MSKWDPDRMHRRYQLGICRDCTNELDGDRVYCAECRKRRAISHLAKNAWRDYHGNMQHCRRAGDSDGTDARAGCYPFRRH